MYTLKEIIHRKRPNKYTTPFTDNEIIEGVEEWLIQEQLQAEQTKDEEMWKVCAKLLKRLGK